MNQLATTRRAVAATALALVALAPAAPAQREGLGKQALRRELTPIWRSLQTDARFQELRAALDAEPFAPEVVERYLRYMPISPLDYLEIDMRQRRYEHVVPRFVVEWHRRWIALHEAKARAWYGDDEVDRVLAGVPGPARDAATGSDPDGGGPAPPPALAPTVGTNRNAAADFFPGPETYQGEIQIKVNPNDPNQIVAAANTWDDIGGTCGNGIQAVFYSSDGGATWGYTCPPDDSGYPGMSCSGSVFGSDPAVWWNDSNEVFLNHMLLCSTGGSTQYAMVVARSADGGATWTGQGVIRNSWPTGNLEDKNFYVVDNDPASPYYGRHYTCWDRDNDEKFAYSTDNGQTWTETDLPTSSGNGSGSRFDLGCDIATEDDGTVHVVFDTLSCLSSCNNEEMFHTRSTDGGASWSSPVEVRDFNLVAFSSNSCPDAQDERCIGPFGAIDVDNTGGACDGTLYVTYTDFTSGSGNDSDVWVTRSTNDGASWSSPVKVNDDGLSGRIQFHPFLVVDPTDGSVVVAWHDARNDAGNDAVDYFVARSTDCGLSFEANVQASQPSAEFNNSGISFSNENSTDNPNNNPNQYGEYLGLDALGGKAYIAWTDTRHFFPGSTGESQEENVGFTVVDFGPPANSPPTVTITAPADGTSVVEGTSVTFSGTATDAEDGDLSASLAWSSSLDGAIGSGASFSTSALSVGTHAITASVTDSGGEPGSDQITLTVTSSGGGDPLSEDFEGGLGGWTTSGLWHLVASSPCASPGYSSPVSALYYGQDSTCTYDAGDNTGDLISPAISGITSSSELTFQYYRQVESYSGGSYDRTEVAVSVAGSGTWTTVWSRDSTDTSLATWTSSGAISLASWAGSDVQLRFRFDTVDGSFNAFTGWLVDDVVVTGDVGGGCADCIDWSSTPTVSYSSQDQSASWAVEDGGDTIALFDNTWRRTSQTFEITPNTVLEVEFSSSVQGEIHGIGFDENDSISDAERVFQLHGTQNWGAANHDFDDYSGGGAFTSYTIPVGQYYTGTMFLVLVNDNDSGSGNDSRFKNVRVYESTPPPGSCAADVDFESGAAGWTNSGASTCSTGSFVVGTPTEVVNGGVVTQLAGDHTTGSGNAFFSAVNTSAGVDDVDGGTCIVTSPVYTVAEASDVSVWTFHGQRDAGDDAGDFFRLEISTDGGSSWTTLRSFGDVTVNAAWSQSTTAVAAGADVQFRLQVADAAGPGDLVEAGIDDVSICPTP